MKSPYPYYGGKSAIMPEVWKRLGDPYNLVDPFMGSNAPLLSRPAWDWTAGAWGDDRNRIETINDADGYVCNFWRAITADPAAVAAWADWPVSELDLHARHKWLVERAAFVERLRAEPDYYDAKIAGWWVWGICAWIGSGWCTKPESELRPHLGNAGQGINRLPQKRPHLRRHGQGVNRLAQRRPDLGKRSNGRGVLHIADLPAYFAALAARLRRVRVTCGDWSRVLGPSPTYKTGLTGVILDPPYDATNGRRGKGLYAVECPTAEGAAMRDNLKVTEILSESQKPISTMVREWAIENGDNPKMRIALFGYIDEHDDEIPGNWERFAWKANGGYSNQNKNGNDNKTKETIWFSPHCLKPKTHNQLSLLGD